MTMSDWKIWRQESTSTPTRPLTPSQRRKVARSKRNSTMEFKESKTTFDSFIVTLVYFSYLAMPAILRVCLTTFNFERVCDTWYFAVDYTVMYTSKKHTLMMLLIAMPGLILYGVLLMVFMLWYLYRSQDQLRSRRFTFRVGLLYSGYRKNKWWWECVVFLRKLTIIIVATFVELPYIQLMLSLVICSLLLVAQQHCMPMEAGKNGSNLLHVVEISSLLILMTILWCSLYFERETNCQSGDVGCEFLGALVILTNVLFFLACVGLFIMSFAAHHNLKRKIGAVKKFIRKKSISRMRGDGLEEKNEVRDAERKKAAEKEVEMSQIELSVVEFVEESGGNGGGGGDGLSQGWEIATDKDGDVYYHNEETGVTQWEKPMERINKWSVNPMKKTEK